MKRYFGGQQVRGGAYLNLASGEFVPVESGGSALPGQPQVRYVRLPLGLATALGPFLGLAYIIFLPLVGFLTLLWVAGRFLSWGVAALGRAVAPAFFPTWKAGFAYFQRQAPIGKRGQSQTRQRKAGPSRETRALEDRQLEEMMQEIRRRRGE